jgi:large subunit ribosomal protein L21
MYAIFRAQGKQFRAVPEATLRIPTLDAEPGDKVTFDEVLLAEKDGDIRVGAPSLDGAAVDAEIVKHGRGEKIIVFKMKRRKGYRKKQGFTEIKIVDISFPKGKKQAIKATAPKVEAPVAEAEVAVVEAEEVSAAPVDTDTAAAGHDDFDITPAARDYAAENGIDLASIEGSGKDGRILKSDIDKAIKEKGE